MPRLAAFVLLVGVAAPALHASPDLSLSVSAVVSQPTPQPAGETLPLAADLFRKHVAAIGGADAVRSHRNRVSRGRAASVPGSDFALVTVWQEAPERLHTRFEKPGLPAIDRFFSDGYGWVVTGGNRGELLRNETLREFRDDADFLADVEFEKRYREMETIEKSVTPGGRTMYHVRVTFTYGKDEIHVFDAETGLRQSVMTSSMTPEGQIPVLIAYQEYRDVSGVRVPHEIVMTVNPGKPNQSQTIITFNSIQANVPSVPSWDMPAALMEIVKKYEAESPPPPAGG